MHLPKHRSTWFDKELCSARWSKKIHRCAELAMPGKSSIKDTHTRQRIVNVSIVMDHQRKHEGLILGHHDVLPLLFILEVVGNMKGT